VTYSKSGQNKKGANKKTAFIPVHSLAATHGITKKLFNVREQSFSKTKMCQFPPTSHGATTPSGLHDHRHTTLGRSSLDELSARRRHLYLASHNTNKRQISIPPAGFALEIPTNEGSQTHTVRAQGLAKMRQNGKKSGFKAALNVSF
jgi:hypothetical protein